MALTKKQRDLVRELDEIVDLTRTDYRAIEKYEPAARTYVLLHMKHKIIRGHIVDGYVFIDELLNVIICKHFFGKKGFIRLWKTKRFQNFNYHILESLSLLRKLRLAKDIVAIDSKIARKVENVNIVRNAIAHLFFPENKSEYKRQGKKVVYAGKDVFSIDGLKLFEQDVRTISATLFPDAYGVSLEEDFPSET